MRELKLVAKSLRVNLELNLVLALCMIGTGIASTFTTATVL